MTKKDKTMPQQRQQHYWQWRYRLATMTDMHNTGAICNLCHTMRTESIFSDSSDEWKGIDCQMKIKIFLTNGRYKARFLFIYKIWKCATANNWRRLLLAVVIVNGIFALDLFIERLNGPPPKIDELRFANGTVDWYAKIPRSSWVKFKVRTNANDTIMFYGVGSKALSSSIVGKKIRVGYRKVISLWFPFYYNDFLHVEQSGRVLVDYDAIYPNMVAWWLDGSRSWMNSHVFLISSCLVILVGICGIEFLDRKGR